MNHVVLIAAPETRQQKDPPLNARFAQKNAFIRRRNSKPCGTLGFKRACTFRPAVTVSIGFHHSADLRPITNVPPDRAKVLLQCTKGHFCPCGSKAHGDPIVTVHLVARNYPPEIMKFPVICVSTSIGFAFSKYGR